MIAMLRALLVVLALSPSIARADCVASASGTSSLDIRLSPRAGVLCLMLVDVHAGATCDPAMLQWTVELGCDATHRIAITDRGRLVSILAPSASRPTWPFVRITWREGETTRSADVRLVDLPRAAALRGAVRATFEGAALRLAGASGEPVLVPFAELEAFADAQSD